MGNKLAWMPINPAYIQKKSQVGNSSYSFNVPSSESAALTSWSSSNGVFLVTNICATAGQPSIRIFRKYFSVKTITQSYTSIILRLNTTAVTIYDFRLFATNSTTNTPNVPIEYCKHYTNVYAQGRDIKITKDTNVTLSYDMIYGYIDFAYNDSVFI